MFLAVQRTDRRSGRDLRKQLFLGWSLSSFSFPTFPAHSLQPLEVQGPFPLSCHVSAMYHSLVKMQYTLSGLPTSLGSSFIFRKAPVSQKSYYQVTFVCSPLVHLSPARLTCRAPATESKEGRQKRFSSSPTEDILGRDGKREECRRPAGARVGMGARPRVLGIQGSYRWGHAEESPKHCPRPPRIL